MTQWCKAAAKPLSFIPLVNDDRVIELCDSTQVVYSGAHVMGARLDHPMEGLDA